MNKKTEIIVLLALLIIILSLFSLFNAPRNVPIVTPFRILEDIGVLRIGEIQIIDNNGSWEIAQIAFPEGLLHGERYAGGDYVANVTIIDNTISFNVGILITHLNNTAPKKRTLEIIETEDWINETYENVNKRDYRKNNLTLEYDFNTLGLKTFRYSTDLAEMNNPIIMKTVGVKIPIWMVQSNNEPELIYEGTFVMNIKPIENNTLKN